MFQIERLRCISLHPRSVVAGQFGSPDPRVSAGTWTHDTDLEHSSGTKAGRAGDE